MNFCEIKSNRNYKYLSFKWYKYHICSLSKLIQNKFQSNSTKMKFLDRGSAFSNIFKTALSKDTYDISLERKLNSASLHFFFFFFFCWI